MELNKRYEIRNMLGRGGMGAVYIAYDRLRGEEVALKRVLSDHVTMLATGDSHAQVRQALTREFRTLSTLRHPHIVSVLDYGVDEDRQPFFTMELLRGGHPITYDKRTPLQNIRLVVQMLQALNYLHRHGVLHRDLKPANVLVTGGTLRLVDFGVAMAATRARGTAGTLAYMAPEVVTSGAPSTASDLYAVGVILYELLTGTHPYDISDLETLRTQIVQTHPNLEPLQHATANLQHGLPQMPAADTFDADADLMTQPEDAALDAFSPMATAVENNHPTAPTHGSPDTPMQPAQTLPPATDTFAQVLTEIPDIVGRLLAKHPAERYQQAAEVIRDLHIAIGEPLPPESVQIRASFLEAAAFVGRESEVEQLHAALNALETGEGSAWLVAGESGVGKSRLLEEIRVEALTRNLLTVYAENTTPTEPFGMWREPLRHLALYSHELSDIELATLSHLVPDIGMLVQRDVPDMTPVLARLEHVMLSITLRFEVPLLLVFDNIAPSQIRTLNRLAARAKGAGVMVLCSVDIDDYPDLLTTAEMQPLILTRFADDDVQQLTRVILGAGGLRPDLQALLAQEAEGNALFVVETLRALAESSGRLHNIASMPLPPEITAGGIAAVLDQHMARVPVWAHPLLHAAAITGRELNFKLLSELAQDSAYTLPRGADVQDWLWAVGEAAIVRPTEQRWVFTHDRIRKRIIAALPDEEYARHRQRLIAFWKAQLDRLDEAKRVRGVTDNSAALAAWQALGHLQRQAEPVHASNSFHAAASYAMDEQRFQLARELALEALALGDQRAALMAVAACRILRRYAEARSLLKRWVDARPDDAPPDVGHIAELARLDLYLGQPARAMLALGDAHWLDVRPRTLWALGRLQAARQAITEHPRHASPREQHIAGAQHYLTHIQAEIELETGNAQYAIRLLEGIRHAAMPHEIRDDVALLLAHAKLEAGLYSESADLLQQLLSHARVIGDTHLSARANTLLARQYRQLGKGIEALNAATLALDYALDAPEMPELLHDALHERAWVLWLGMQGGRARDLLREHPTAGDPLPLQVLRILSEYLGADDDSPLPTLHDMLQSAVQHADTLRQQDRYQHSPRFHYTDGLLQMLRAIIEDTTHGPALASYQQATRLPLMAGQLADAALKLHVVEATTGDVRVNGALQVLYAAGPRAS